MFIAGLKFLDFWFWLQSITILLEIPVVSSIVSLKDIPCFKSTYFAKPFFSAIIGNVYGSHSAITWFIFTCSSLPNKSLEPKGMLVENFSSD